MLSILCLIVAFAVGHFGEKALCHYRYSQQGAGQVRFSIFLTFVVFLTSSINLYYSTVKWEAAVLGAVVFMTGSLFICQNKSFKLFRDQWKRVAEIKRTSL
jgi:hypothetical protein